MYYYFSLLFILLLAVLGIVSRALQHARHMLGALNYVLNHLQILFWDSLAKLLKLIWILACSLRCRHTCGPAPSVLTHVFLTHL